MNDQILIAEFLESRAISVDAVRPSCNPAAQAVLEKYGIREGLGRGIIAAALMAVAVGLATPNVSAKSHHGNGRNVEASIECHERALEQIKAYRPLEIQEGCVVNSVLFRHWLEKEFPGTPVHPVTIAGEFRGVSLHHEGNLVRLGEDYYLHESNFGLRKVDLSEKQSRTFSVEKVAKIAEDRFLSEYRRTNGRGTISMIPTDRSLSDADAAYESLKDHVPSELIKVDGVEMLAFIDRDRVCVYNSLPQSAGTVRAKFNSKDQVQGGVLQIASYLLKKEQKSYQKIKGDILRAPNVASTLDASPLEADIAVAEKAVASTNYENIVQI